MKTYDQENEKWFWSFVILCISVGYMAASLLNPQFALLIEDASSTTLGHVIQECDPAIEAPITMDQMVLGTHYNTWSDEVFERWVNNIPEIADYNYPEDLVEISHYTVIYRPNYPSIVELYSYSTDTTWFRVYPDNFNSINTRACGVYQAVR